MTYEEHLALQIRIPNPFIDHIRRRIRDRKIQQPVRRGRHAQRFGAHFQREQFAGDHPRHRTPGAGEEKDVDAHEGYGDLLRALVVGSSDCAGDGDDVLADAHADCAHEEEVAAAHFLDEVEAWEGGDDVYGALGFRVSGLERGVWCLVCGLGKGVWGGVVLTW